MNPKIGCIGAVLFATLQMGCGKQAPPPPAADTTSAPPPGAMVKALAPPPGMRIGTQKEYDSIQTARRKADSALKARADSMKR